jgi:hypothetical protein
MDENNKIQPWFLEIIENNLPNEHEKLPSNFKDYLMKNYYELVIAEYGIFEKTKQMISFNQIANICINEIEIKKSWDNKKLEKIRKWANRRTLNQLQFERTEDNKKIGIR